MLSFPVLYESYSRLYASCIDLHYACRKDQTRQNLEVPPKVAQSTQPDTHCTQYIINLSFSFGHLIRNQKSHLSQKAKLFAAEITINSLNIEFSLNPKKPSEAKFFFSFVDVITNSQSLYRKKKESRSTNKSQIQIKDTNPIFLPSS